MPSCSALNCKNRVGIASKKKNITFHKFPTKSDPERSKKWVINMCRDNFKPHSHSLLCSVHFTEECFDKTGQIVRLKTGAVPTIFSFPRTLQKSKKQKKIHVKTVKDKKITNTQRVYKNGKKITMSNKEERISSERHKMYHYNEGERETNNTTHRKQLVK
ncbi:THAP domain-containing protein 3-like isoform X3 [Limulus polyphemus]|nr:THAP domain-containing protein 3-like isoform X3 [Limulus polyphemus]